MPRKKKEEKVEINIDFPVFSIDGNDYLNEAVGTAMDIQNEMQGILDTLDNLNNKLENSGLQLNLYINNIIKLDSPYDFVKHVILFDKDNTMYFYDHELAEKAIEDYADDDEFDNYKLLECLPKQTGYNLNKKQFAKCFNLIEEYNQLAISYECNLLEFEACGEEYEELMELVRSELSNIKIIEVRKTELDSDFEVEPFNKNKHELVITQDTKTKKWNFVYIRKKDKSKLMAYLKQNDIEY